MIMFNVKQNVYKGYTIFHLFYIHGTLNMSFFQDLDSLQIHLEEVRFFDLFGYSKEEGAWLCFMCNNPEKATGTQTLTRANQDT